MISSFRVYSIYGHLFIIYLFLMVPSFYISFLWFVHDDSFSWLDFILHSFLLGFLYFSTLIFSPLKQSHQNLMLCNLRWLLCSAQQLKQTASLSLCVINLLGCFGFGYGTPKFLTKQEANELLLFKGIRQVDFEGSNPIILTHTTEVKVQGSLLD